MTFAHQPSPQQNLEYSFKNKQNRSDASHKDATMDLGSHIQDAKLQTSQSIFEKFD